MELVLAIKISRTSAAYRDPVPGEPSLVQVTGHGRGVMRVRMSAAEGYVLRHFDYDPRFPEFALPPEAYQYDDWIADAPADAIDALGKLA